MRNDVVVPYGEGQRSRGVGDERFRRRSVLLPVPLVGGPDALEIDRERRVPVADPRRIGEPGIFRRQRAVAARAVHRHASGVAEFRARCRQAVVVRPEVVLEGDLIASPGLQVGSSPRVEPYRRMGHCWKVGRCGLRVAGCRVVPSRVDSRHDRVRHFAWADANRIGQVREDIQVHKSQPPCLGPSRRDQRV